jgi:phage baseplate assembly protein W
MKQGLYKGFSSRQFEYNKSFTLLDVEIVKRDLLNHIFTRLGERIDLPNFGTRIQDMLMEPMDDDTLDILMLDVQTVIDYDPRVELQGDVDMAVDYENHMVSFTAQLWYVELDLSDLFDLHLEFDDVS